MPSRENLSLLPLPEEKERSWQPDAWMPRHNLAVQLHALGHTNKEIALITGYTENRVSIIINDPRAREIIQDTLASISGNITDLHTRLKIHAVEALDEIVNELRHSRDERVKQKAAFGLLDRAGYTPVHKQVIIGASISEVVAKRMEAAQAKLEAIDAEYLVVEADTNGDSGQSHS